MKVMVIVKATRASEAGQMPSTELLAGRRSVVQDVRARPVTLSQSRVEEYSQVVSDGAERKPGDGR